MIFKTVLLWMIGCSLLALTYAATWDYDTNGPSTWGANYPNCNGDSQSPIDIVTASAEVNYTLPIVNRSYFYTPPTRMTVRNNGHTILMTFDEGSYVINDNNLLPFPAQMAQYHLHWGNYAATPTTSGAEHTFNGKHYFGELHAVHFNTKYATLAEALNKTDGLAVFGWFIDVTYPQKNQDIELFLQAAKNGAGNLDATQDVTTTFSLETLLPPDLNVYYRYFGSLTTPTCDESVVWTVFEQPIEISSDQALFLSQNFYSTSTNDKLTVNNFRPVQSLNGRKVTKPAPLVQDSGSRPMQASSAFLIAVVACAIALKNI